ncbi:hypothetical protein KBC79_04060 [Candidatus Woesebacteria bacterium]|nr:hypothetical protein [Candidatus Woesebacteria bacterium]
MQEKEIKKSGYSHPNFWPKFLELPIEEQKRYFDDQKPEAAIFGVFIEALLHEIGPLTLANHFDIISNWIEHVAPSLYAEWEGLAALEKHWSVSTHSSGAVNEELIYRLYEDAQLVSTEEVVG